MKKGLLILLFLGLLSLGFLSFVSANAAAPITSYYIYFEKDGKPYNKTIDYTISCKGWYYPGNYINENKIYDTVYLLQDKYLYYGYELKVHSSSVYYTSTVNITCDLYGTNEGGEKFNVSNYSNSNYPLNKNCELNTKYIDRSRRTYEYCRNYFNITFNNISLVNNPAFCENEPYNNNCICKTGTRQKQKCEANKTCNSLMLSWICTQTNVISNQTQTNSSCSSIGLRKDGKYCFLDTWQEQKNETSSCENSFECSSNVCVNNQCISGNLIQKIINWFKKLFGG